MLFVRQCLRNSVSRNQREMNVLLKYHLRALSAFEQCPNLYRSLGQLKKTDSFLRKGKAIYTSCTYFNRNDNKSNFDASSAASKQDGEVKLTLVQKFKLMYKQYWYVLIPVHTLTSCIWFGSFYYLIESGVNIAELLESIHAPNSMIEVVKNSKAGSIVAAYTLYKIATPVRYPVTLGGTTIAINYLKKWGWIKPVPNKEEIKRMYKEQKGAFKDLASSYQGKIQLKKDEIKQQYVEARDGLQRSVREDKQNFKDGIRAASEEWKHIGGLIMKAIKRKFLGKD